jgi:prepilin-type N-terminal cleavage/methylation domain-containing protein
MSLKTKKKTGGFTLVEVMITVTIIAILSSTVAISIDRYVLEKKGEEKVLAFFSQLQIMRTYAQRDNVRYLVKLAPDPSTAFEIYKDIDSSYECKSGKTVQLFPDQNFVAKAIKIGKAEGSTISGDGVDIDDVNNDITGEWKSTERCPYNKIVLKSDNDGGYLYDKCESMYPISSTIIFENDEIGNISKGIVFIKNASIKSICYAIVRPKDKNTLKLYKWSGHNWNEL